MIRYGEGSTGKEALLDLFLPMTEEGAAAGEIQGQVQATRRLALLELVEALKKWQETGGHVRK